MCPSHESKLIEKATVIYSVVPAGPDKENKIRVKFDMPIGL